MREQRSSAPSSVSQRMGSVAESKMYRARFAATLIVICLAISSCAPRITRTYDESPKPRSELAVILTVPPVQFHSVDGRQIQGFGPPRIVKNFGDRIEVLPGTHTIVVFYFLPQPGVVSHAGNVAVTIDAQAGECYVIKESIISKEGASLFRPMARPIDPRFVADCQ